MTPSPTKRHVVVAALIVVVCMGLLCLAAVKYIDFGQDRKLTSYEALAGSLQLASIVDSAEAPAVRAALGEAAGPLLESGSVRRAFFVKKGEHIKALDVSRPAKVIADFGSEGEDSVREAREKLVTLCARLEQYFREGGKALDLNIRDLSWARPGTAQIVVGSYPAFVDGEFVGVAGVEVDFISSSALLAVEAVVMVAGFALLLVLFLVLLKSSRPAYALSALVLLAVTAVSLWFYNDSVASDFVSRREAATTRFVNGVVWQKPEALATLDSVWAKVFKTAAVDLQVGAAGTAGSFAVLEGPEVVAGMTFDRTYPVLVILLLGLAIGLAVLGGLSEVVWGIVRLPGVYAYIAPAMIGMVVLVLIPFVMGVGLGFFNMDYEFVGFDNFSDILFPSAESDTNFYFTLGVTVLWTVSNVVLHVSIGLFMALILVNPKVKWKGLFRVLLIIPWAVPNYITALIWKWMFTSELGAINLMLNAVGVENPPHWFGPSFWTNFFAVLATNTWLGFPFMMVVSMGALQSIPGELYEAADIDGASRWQKFRNITLPLLRPALFPAIILGSIWTFNMFNIIYLVTRGNPDNKTNILITEAYRFFQELNQYGVAAAYCVFIFVILLGYTLITDRVTKATQGAFE